MVSDFFAKGWCVLPLDARIKAWAEEAWLAGQRAMRAPDLAQWWVCENTWFVGVDALPNAASGELNAVPFAGAPVDWISNVYGNFPALHPAQLSVVTPGYPKPRDGESDAAFRYRVKRDAAHVDGLLRGAGGARYLQEPHAWILGMPLTENTPDESPLVVWEGSHEIMRRALKAALMPHVPVTWAEIDISAAYQEARREVFATCARVPALARPGEAVLLHRLSLHGIAPWGGVSNGGNTLRASAFFRPMLQAGTVDWLTMK